MRRAFEILWRDITIFGSAVFYAFLLGLVFALGEIQLFLQLLVGFVLSFALTAGIRAVYFRERPKRRPYNNFLERLDSSSFPSLHAMRAIILLVLFANYYQTVWMVLLFFGIFVVVVVSRYFLKKHHISDLVAGVAFGILIAQGILMAMP